MENMLYITDKGNRTKLFKLNYAQSQMMNHIEFCLANEIPIRIKLLKARQIGATTFFTALGMWVAAMHTNANYSIVAHRHDSAQSIFEKTKIFYNHLPKEMKPETTRFSSEGITFDKKNGKGINSRISFSTVGEGVYRGTTITYLHKSESAFWEGNIQAINNSLAPTVAYLPGTFIVDESTANGYNHYKNEWDKAVRGDSDYTPFFFGWQDHKEYTLEPVPKGFEKTLTERELELKNKFNLTLGQVAWRRKMLDNEYNGNELWFAQEYPMTAEEAFVAAGAGVFDAETIAKGYEACTEPQTVILKETGEKLYVWEFPQTETEEIRQQKVEWNVDKQEYEYVDTELVLEERFYKTPYTLGIDTSGMGADNNRIAVINNITKKLAARFTVKTIAEERLAEIAVEIAKMYNDAMITPEVNYSYEIVNYMLKLGYKNIYITESLSRQDKKIVGGIQYGWKTTTLTKPQMISNLRALLNADPTLIQDKDFWYEAEYYQLTDPARNIMNAASGYYDDLIIAIAIGVYTSSSMQAKQVRQLVKDKVQGNFLLDLARQTKKSPKIRRGIYTNKA